MNVNLQWQPGMTLDEVERICIEAAYSFYHKNKTQTSIALGISIRTLDAKLEKYADEQRIRVEKQAADVIRNKEINDRLRGIIPNAQSAKYKSEDLPSATTGLRLESPSQTPAKYDVPVQVEHKVQEVLPSQTASSGKKRGRPALQRSNQDGPVVLSNERKRS